MLNVDSDDLHSFNPELYSKLIKYPSEVITLMDGAVKLVYAEIADIQAETAEVQVGHQTFFSAGYASNGVGKRHTWKLVLCLQHVL